MKRASSRTNEPPQQPTRTVILIAKREARVEVRVDLVVADRVEVEVVVAGVVVVARVAVAGRGDEGGAVVARGDTGEGGEAAVVVAGVVGDVAAPRAAITIDTTVIERVANAEEEEILADSAAASAQTLTDTGEAAKARVHHRSRPHLSPLSCHNQAHRKLLIHSVESHHPPPSSLILAPRPLQALILLLTQQLRIAKRCPPAAPL
jgi:hypothetical protein